MTNIIVAFAKLDDAKSIKNVLVKNGFSVAAICTSGAQVLNYVDEFHDGIVICGYRLTDMLCVELKENLPSEIEMITMASQRVLVDVSCTNIVGLAMPLKVHELINTVNLMADGIIRRRKKNREKQKARSQEEITTIAQAKQLLMDRNHMTEEEAHRYLQKHSMDNSISLVETAQMVLSIM